MIKLTYLLLTITLFGTGCTTYRYYAYVPTYFQDKRLVAVPDSLDTQHVENIQRVFRYYDVPFKVENGAVLVRRKISQEMMQNYTAKASDKKWIREH